MKKYKSQIFIQDIPPYRHSVLVCAGITAKQAVRFAKKNFKESRVFTEYFEKNKDLFDDVLSGKQLGYAAKHEDGYLLLILQRPDDTWKYWECLIHELSHILDWIVEMKMLQGETEARGYLHEYLFREIRRTLMP